MDREGSAMQDREALLALYWSTGGPRWKRQQGWAQNAPDLGSWYGVTVNPEGRVTKVDLQANALEGVIPGALGLLTGLSWLRLSRNSLTGAIPPHMGKLKNLNFVDMRTNQLTGSIPAELGQLSKVMQIDLSCNLLAGPIPPELGRLKELCVLWLEKNFLEGPIPAELSLCKSLKDLDVTENRMKETRLQGESMRIWTQSAKRGAPTGESSQCAASSSGSERRESISSGVRPGTSDFAKHLQDLMGQHAEALRRAERR